MSTSLTTDSLLLQLFSSGGLYGFSQLEQNLAMASPYAATTATGTNGVSQTISSDQAQMSGLDQLSAAVSSFQAAMEGLLTPSQVAPATASTSNAGIATATALSTAVPDSYNVTVNSLAQAQTVTSGAFADPDTSIVGSGTLTIQTGTYDSGSNTFTVGGSPAVSISVTNGSLDSIASAINGANAGVTASVVQDSSGYHLQLTSTATGAANGFSVSVTDGDGTNTDTTGLSQLAYDPTAGSGAGKNLTETVAAQDASLTVDGLSQTSASNAGVSIAPDVTLNLYQAGSVTVTVAQDSAELQSAAQNFVTAYNNLEGTLTSLTGTSGALANDPAAQQLLQQLTDTYTQGYAAGSFGGLAQIGIEAQGDGTLTLDSGTLLSAASTDMTSTVSVLNQAAQAMDTLSSTYVGGGAVIPSEQSALQQDLTSLQDLNNVTSTTSGLDSATQSQTAIQQYQAILELELMSANSSSLLNTSLYGGSGLIG